MSSSSPSTSSEQSLVGTQLGKYQIRAEIGRGGMGTVYKAYDPTLDRFVALKTLAPHLAWEKEFVDRFLREARAAARLKHPSIVTIYDVGRAGGWYYFAMDHVPGETLAGIIQRHGALALEETLRILRPLADALDYAHDRGLVHRDVKPSNIIIGPQGEVTLTDFGIARAARATRLTRTGAVMGTPEYMAPEQARGDEVDRRADQYALAIVAYVMLAGKAPFEADSTPTLLYKIVHEAPPSLRAARPDLPERAEDALQRALAKEKDQRYGSCGEFVEALEEGTRAVLTDSVPKEREVAPPAQPGPGGERRRTAVLGLGGLGLVIVGFLCLGVVVGGVLVGLYVAGGGGASSVTPSPTFHPSATPRPVTGTPPPSPVAPSTNTPSSQRGSILLQDGFDNPASGWEVGDYEEGSVGYKRGGYSVISLGNARPMWGVANEFLTDVVVEVDATQVLAGPEHDNDYGVGCRIQPDGDGYYLLVSGDGYYGIWLNWGPDWVPLVDFTETDVVRRGNARNHIRAVCDGSYLALFVNGQPLAEVEDATLVGGDVALAATSYEDAPTEVSFDDIVVYVPPD